jgi:hypothetical protein
LVSVRIDEGQGLFYNPGPGAVPEPKFSDFQKSGKEVNKAKLSKNHLALALKWGQKVFQF